MTKYDQSIHKMDAVSLKAKVLPVFEGSGQWKAVVDYELNPGEIKKYALSCKNWSRDMNKRNKKLSGSGCNIVECDCTPNHCEDRCDRGKGKMRFFGLDSLIMITNENKQLTIEDRNILSKVSSI